MNEYYNATYSYILLDNVAIGQSDYKPEDFFFVRCKK